MSYSTRPSVSSARLTAREEVVGQPQYLAIASSRDTWVTGTPAGVRIYRGMSAVADYAVPYVAAGAIDFSADGQALHLGLGKVDVATGTSAALPAVADLSRWAAHEGFPAPPTLTVSAARYSDDGKLLVATATGRTRDRRNGLSEPAEGSEDWLIELDGVSRSPLRVLWHGRGPHERIAIGPAFIAAGGQGGLRMFPRAGGEAIDLTSQLRAIIAIAWSPDGELFVAWGEQKKLALWKSGAWDAPLATLIVGTDYGSSLAFHPTRPLLLTGGRDGKLRVWAVDAARHGAPVELLVQDLGGVVNQIAIAPAGDAALVAVGAPVGKIRRFELALEP